MSDDKPAIPFESPVVPQRLSPDSKIRFDCHKGISCFNACCRQADITLTPYDILRLKKRLGMTSSEFLDKHTVPYEMDQHGMPGVKLRTEDEQPVCLLVTDEGCSVYADRPTACRYYPAGLLSMRASGSPTDEAHYFVVQEEHCKGHEEPKEQTIAEYRREQGVEEYDELNRDWYRIILKKRSAGPAIGAPPEMTFQLFFMASYDIDRFRRFVRSDAFGKTYQLDEDQLRKLEQDDIVLMQFGFRLMKQVFFDEQTIPLVEGAVEKRLEERREIIEQRRQTEIENWREKQEQAKKEALDED
ncbi:MAG: YkgJ family cysteine cluster protein [Pseudomonadota bacterium]|nr:YkgJ family cysteine cluster protein [Pseudomonadota bacterium]